MPKTKPPAKPHTAGISAAATTAVGLIGVAASNPPQDKTGWIMFGLAALGSLLQAFTKPATAGETDLVAK